MTTQNSSRFTAASRKNPFAPSGNGRPAGKSPASSGKNTGKPDAKNKPARDTQRDGARDGQRDQRDGQRDQRGGRDRKPFAGKTPFKSAHKHENKHESKHENKHDHKDHDGNHDGKTEGHLPRGPKPWVPERMVVGRHPVRETLEHQPQRGLTLYIAEGAQASEDLQTIVELAQAHQIGILRISREDLDSRSGDIQNQGVVLTCRDFPYANEYEVIDELLENEEAPLVVALDGVEDPRNLGATARAAFAMGAHLVVIPKDRAASATASAHKAAAGALARIPVAQVTNLRRFLDDMRKKNLWIVGAEADGKATPWQVDWKLPTVLVVGGEDRGLRPLTRAACDTVVTIPMADASCSLNAADAATVLLYESLRQRRSAVSKAAPR